LQCIFADDVVAVDPCVSEYSINGDSIIEYGDQQLVQLSG